MVWVGMLHQDHYSTSVQQNLHAHEKVLESGSSWTFHLGGFSQFYSQV